MFAVCGCLSSGILSFVARVTHVWEPWPYLLLPIPFALLCARLIPRMRPVAAAVALMSVVWPLAQLATVMSNSWALSTLSNSLSSRFPCDCVGGLVGGFTLTLVLCFFMCVWQKSGERLKRLLSAKYLCGGAAVGFVGALPLQLQRPGNFFDLPMEVYFSIWQMLVGTYLYAVYICANGKAAQPEDSDAHGTVAGSC